MFVYVNCNRKELQQGYLFYLFLCTHILFPPPKMVNLTLAFTEIVFQFEQQRGIRRTTNDSVSPLISDTFIAESADLHSHISELQTFLQNIKPRYLINDTGKYRASEGSDNDDGSLTENERDQIDSDARIQLKQYNERFKHLENYETKRVESKSYFTFNQSQSAAVNSHRKGILLSLSYQLKASSKLLLNMQEVRLSRRRDIDSDNDLSNRLSSINVRDLKYSIINEPHDPKARETTDQMFQLTQEQIQILETENSHLLNSKLEDLVKVEKIHKSVLEISQLESELANHLQLQSESINNLLNDYDMTEGDLKEGNKILKKNKKSGNTAAKMVMFIAFLLGFILLLLDWRYN